MDSKIIKKGKGILILLLCLIFIQTLALQAQIRPRGTRDSIQAKVNGYWYIPANYQFEVQYPKLQVIPPLSTGMPYDILLAYIYLDSLMRNTNHDILYQIYLHRWLNQKIKNDTIVQAVKYLYKLIDYDPVRFYQYMSSLSSAFYQINLISLDGIVCDLLDNIVLGTPNQIAMNHLLNADYILKIHVNSINSLPWIEYPNKQIKPNQYVYQVNATVLDTLKGKIFQQCITSPPVIKNMKNKTLVESSNICFTYVTGPYSNIYDGYKVDQSLLDSSGNLSLTSGQNLIVTLSHGNYLWDNNYDYFELSLMQTFPVINGQVKDINHVWSNSTLLVYPFWRNAFLQKRDMLLNGGY